MLDKSVRCKTYWLVMVIKCEHAWRFFLWSCDDLCPPKIDSRVYSYADTQTHSQHRIWYMFPCMSKLHWNNKHTTQTSHTSLYPSTQTLCVLYYTLASELYAISPIQPHNISDAATKNDTICFGGTRHETASSAQTTTQRHHICTYDWWRRLLTTSTTKTYLSISYRNTKVELECIQFFNPPPPQKKSIRSGI